MLAWLLDAGMLEFAMDAGSLLDLVCLSFICPALFYVSFICFIFGSYVKIFWSYWHKTSCWIDMMYLFRYCGFALFEYFPSVIYCWIFSGVTPVTQERLAPFARPFSFPVCGKSRLELIIIYIATHPQRPVFPLGGRVGEKGRGLCRMSLGT